LRCGHLIEDVQLERWRDVGEKNVLGLTVFFGDGGVELREHIEVGERRLASVQIVAVLTSPPKRRTIADLKASQVDPAVGQQVQVLLREIGANHTDYLDIGEV
jgi:hypothetical protein